MVDKLTAAKIAAQHNAVSVLQFISDLSIKSFD